MNQDIQPNFLDQQYPRKAQRERAESHASPEVMERYERVLRSAGPVLVRFIGAEITAEYERRFTALSVSDSRV